MPNRVQRPQLTWAGIPTGEMCLQLGISIDTLRNLRLNGTLPRGIYWYTMPGSDRIFWVKDLVRDFVVNGDSPAHQKAIEKYLASLPSSDRYVPSAA